MQRHAVIEAVSPSVDCGRHPVKRVVGDLVVIEADVFRDGHDLLDAAVLYRTPGGQSSEAPMRHFDNDRWRAELRVTEIGRWRFTVRAWTDVFGSWRADLKKKVDAGQTVALEVEEGARLIATTISRATGHAHHVLDQALRRLSAATHTPEDALRVALEPALGALMSQLGDRADATTFEPWLDIVVDRAIARFGAWYEMFPRSQSPDPSRGATLSEAALRLSEIRDLGFDVVYLPPVHPIGKSFRKGKNNALVAAPSDPGSPWAIGSEAGGHTAIEPELGTIADFDRFVETARNLGLEIALDYAIQCSPDHPWVKEHPDWFYVRPDGSIKYAENPPKKYQDVYPMNFDTPDRDALWAALRDVFLFWIAHGVTIFRVDNPHTKPVEFWRWVLADVKARHPETVFLSEAFTRPKMMKVLAKVGFTQSYTYFTWRNTKQELTEYVTELASSESREYFRPNFFPNTPDILPEILQDGGRPAFKMRLVLAATLSPAYGIYSGYELCENEALPGREEYKDSEKYEIKNRDFRAPGNLCELTALVNRIRRENAALHVLDNITFLPSDNDHILFYAKATADRTNILLIAINVDPHHVHAATVHVPPELLGVAPGTSYDVVDLLTGARYTWGQANYVRLDPLIEPAHVLRVEPAARTGTSA